MLLCLCVYLCQLIGWREGWGWLKWYRDCVCVRETFTLKVPKREIFLTELIILSYPIWTGDLGTKAKNRFV
jgi:hypothetical protein